MRESRTCTQPGHRIQATCTKPPVTTVRTMAIPTTPKFLSLSFFGLIEFIENLLLAEKPLLLELHCLIHEIYMVEFCFFNSILSHS